MTTRTTFTPRRELSRYVHSVRAVDRTPETYVRVPDGEVELVLRLGQPHDDLHVIGPRMRPLVKPAADVARAVAVRFLPGGAYPFFGVPMSELEGRIISIATLWGREGADLRDSLVEARSQEERAERLEDALAARLQSSKVFEPTSAHLARRAMKRMTESEKIPRVSELAKSLDLSERHLRRLFEEVVGLSPKEVARVIRFQRALRTHAQLPDWGAVAIAVGYYDQAHLIAEFRALAGSAPGRLHL